MLPFRAAPAVAAAMFVVSAGIAEGARSRLTCIDGSGGVKTLQPEAITDVGPGQVPEAVVAVLSARLRIVDSLPTSGIPGLAISKSTLAPQLAYGAGRPNGYTGGGSLNPAGPWVGLTWPFRDFNDGHADPGGAAFPLGNDVGMITAPSPGQYLVSGISGRMAFATTNPASYMRGIPGSGGADFATYFSIDIAPLVGTPRMVTVFLEDVVVRTLIEDSDGRLVTQDQTAPPISLSFEIPSPACAPVLLGLAVLRRRRRAH